MINLLCIIKGNYFQHIIDRMSLFSNQNFINQLSKECGIANLEEDVSAILQVFVQIQTRRLIQEAAKFMKNQRRDAIDFQDVQSALVNLNHHDLVLVEQEEQYHRDGSSYIRRDPIYTSPKLFIQQQLKSLTLNSFSQPNLRARWIYIDGKIPRINENNMLKAKSQILSIRQKELGEKDKKFNIIMDQPQSMLTGYQLDYFKETTQLLSQEGDNVGRLDGVDLEGNLSNLFPLILKFLLGTPVTELKIVYFLELLKNKYIQRSAEFHLHQILTYLWAYQGEHCLEVGQRIGAYIKNFGQKYPMLYSMWIDDPTQKHSFQNSQIRATAYCNAIKRMGIEIEQGTQIKISRQLLQWMQKDNNTNTNTNKNTKLSQNSNLIKIASIFKQVVNEYSGRVSCLRTYILAFWIPTSQSIKDCYMLMNL